MSEDAANRLGQHRTRFIPIGVVVVLSILGGLLFNGRFMDDAYISFRYAYFFGEGPPYYWNYADAPVEGFTNLLWTLLLIPIAHFPAIIETTVHWFAVALVAGTGIILTLWGRRYGGNRGAAVGVGLFSLLLATAGFWDGALNGIETPLYLFGLVLGTLLVLDDRYLHKPLLPALALMLIVLIRFDGVIFASILGLVYYLRSRRAESNAWQSSRPIQAVLLLFAALSLFRLVYLGNIVPLSVNAKTTNWITLLRHDGVDGFLSYLSLVVARGGQYAVDFLRVPSVWLVVGAFVLALVWSSNSIPVKLLLAAIPVGALTIVILNWGDWMPGFRLLIPFLGVMTAVAVGPLSVATERLSIRVARSMGAILATAIMLAALSGVTIPNGIAGLASPEFHRSYEAQSKDWGPYWETVLEDDEIYTASRGGALPYSAPTLRNFGYHGLFDECIGRSGYTTQGSTGKRNWDCVFDNRPAALDANNVPFGVGIAEQAVARDYEMAVALCGTDIRLTGGNMVFFVADWKIESARVVDPNLILVPLSDWLENPDAFASGASCDTEPMSDLQS